MIPLLVLGCSEIRIKPAKDAPVDPDDPQPLSLSADAIFDPLFGSAEIALRAAPADRMLEITIYDPDGDPVRHLSSQTDADGDLTISWDGRTDDGGWVSVGRYRIALASLSEETEIAVVRAGVTAARLEDDDGVSALREPLYWPVEGELQSEDEPVAVLSAIDDGERPLDFPAAMRGPTRPADPDRTEPVAYRFDARPLLSLTVAETSALGGTGLDEVDIDLSIDGFTVLAGNPLRPGADVLLQRDEPLGETVGVSSFDLVMSFRAGDREIGQQVLPLHIYRLLAPSQFTNPDANYRPWVPVVDEALSAIEGTPAEPELVLDALDAFVYYDLDLVYDTNSGASAYTEYIGFDWDRPHFYLSDFLQRRFGNVINCSDAGTILGAYANMVGARLDHVIISPSFDLNYILAIGGTEFTSCPFGPWGCGFSYHAVTTHPGTEAIWDATLALDGDSDPGALPSTEMLVQTVPADEYLDRLVRSGAPSYHSQSQETLQ